jgi:DNA-binding CsgD family transcriptional regulator
MVVWIGQLERMEHARMSKFETRIQPRLLLAGTFSLIALLVGWDLLSDGGAGVDTLHIVIESLVLIIAAGSGLFLLLRHWQQKRRLGELARQMQQARADSVRWRSRYHDTIQGLGQAIQSQFAEWQLSGAESEIALLILKGLSLGEIADLRQTSERTVRDQARAVYRKSGLSNRASLSAYFLEDLLLPLGDEPE